MAMKAINSIDSHKRIHCWALWLKSLATGRLEGHESEKGLEGLFEGNECLFEGNEGHESDEGLEPLDVSPGWWIVWFPHHSKKIKRCEHGVKLCYPVPSFEYPLNILWISFEFNPPTTIVSTFDACVAWKKRIGESILSHVCEKLPTSLRFAEHIWVSWCDMFFDMIWFRDFLKLPASRLELGIIFSKVHGVGHKCCFYDHFLIHHEMKSTHLRTCQFQAHLRKCPDLPLMWYVLWHDMIWYVIVWYGIYGVTLRYYIIFYILHLVQKYIQETTYWIWIPSSEFFDAHPQVFKVCVRAGFIGFSLYLRSESSLVVSSVSSFGETILNKHSHIHQN